MTQWKVFVRESHYLNVGYLRISTFGVWLTVFPELQLAMLEQKQLTAPSSSQTETVSCPSSGKGKKKLHVWKIVRALRPKI